MIGPAGATDPAEPTRRAWGRGWIQLAEGFRIAFDTIAANRVRSGLTILGVSVGVAVVVLLSAFVSGLRTSITDSFEASGPRNITVARADFTAAEVEDDSEERPWWMRPKITPAEAERLRRLPSVREALYGLDLSVTMDFDGRRLPQVQSAGYAAGWPAYTQGDFVAGRDFTTAEVRQSRAVVVLSEALAQELFGFRDPIGQRVGMANTNSSSADRREFTVIGVFAPAPNIFSAVIKHWTVVPYSAALKQLSAFDGQARILVVPEDSVPQARVKDDVTATLRGMRGLRPSDPNEFALIESEQVLAMVDRFATIVVIAMLALTSAALMVGGVGVIGIMLISVTERTREIGIRKAMGATRREILWQFLVEAGLLTVLGAAVGLAVGGGIANLVEAFTPVPAQVPTWAIVSALVMAAITGMLFGLIPAVRASRLEPVAALRFE
jgi:putative ABC transport system permease protein